jgi:CAAX protease family protein
VEELFFRGLLYPVLNRALGAVASLSITAALFAALHTGQLAHAWGPLFALFLVGLVLTLVRARYQSVAASILVHMAYNSTLFAFLYVSTGGFRHMEMLNR